MLVWADGDAPVSPAQLHVGFKLDRLGESIGLFAPNGDLIDSVTFGTQTNNISQGRYPDGGSELRYFSESTPGASNVPAFNLTSATVDQSGNVAIVWQSTPGQSYRLQFKNDLSDANWSDLGEVTATGTAAQKLDPIGAAATRFYRIVTP